MPDMQSVARWGATTEDGVQSRPWVSNETIGESHQPAAGNSANHALSDADLVKGILAADDVCFNVLYERYFNRVYAYSYRRLRNHSDAEEVTQETFMTVFRSISIQEPLSVERGPSVSRGGSITFAGEGRRSWLTSALLYSQAPKRPHATPRPHPSP